MKRNLLSLLAVVFISTIGQSQTPTWAENIAPILYKNCAKCHNSSGIAPFALITYDDAYRNRFGIRSSVVSKNMPPWPPDPNYRHLANERVLSNADIAAITAWANGGAPQGNPAKAPTPPTFAAGGEVASPDLVLKMPTYNINTTNDLYRCFVIPASLLEDRFITEVEILPGNRRVVHHVLAFQDTTNVPLQLDAADPLPGYTNYGGTGSNASELIVGWVPGQGKIKYPSGMGIRLRKGANVVLQVHYPGGVASQQDSTKIVLKFAPQGSANRELFNRPILNHQTNLVNGPLSIPANQTRSFVERLTLPLDGSFLSIAPHMHLIGRRTKVYGLMPNGDTLRLINIPDWDFNWQGAYGFRNVLKIPRGATLVAEAFYDNTVNNPYNPNNPPKLVSLGEGTADEMMLNYFTFMSYQPGDENIVLDTSAIVSSIFEPAERERLSLKCQPNPTQSQMSLVFNMPEADFGNVDIFALNGIAVKGIAKGQWFEKGSNQIQIMTADLPSGVYIVRFSSEKTYGIERFVRVE